MKTTIKTLVSVFVLAFFMLIAWATSDGNDYFGPAYVDFLVKNQSDSCTVSSLNLIYRVRRDNIDTLRKTALEILPSDSLYLTEEALKFLSLQYTCNCPDSAFLQEGVVVIDSFSVNELNLDCD